MVKRILITPGEPAGIGPDVTIKLAQHASSAELIVIADPTLLADRAKQLGLSLQLKTADLEQPAQPTAAGTIKIIPVTVKASVIAGKLNKANSSYVIETLDLAAKLCLEKKAHAVVTGPVNKEVINAAKIPFTGHTEFFSHASHVAQTVMLFVVDQLKVALLTTHLPLSKVSQAITNERIQRITRILHHALQQQFNIAAPRILVCGLNPHAGEGGYLGREEIDTISPALNVLRDQGMNLIGPLPADTIFTPNQIENADAVLAMYHDQALPVIKHIGFDRAVNVTLGLPFIRTSVDHGTAIDIAGTGKADAGSMMAAVKLAIELDSN